MNNEFISSLKNKIDIVDLIGQYVDLKKSGSNYKACCPFHKEKTPSFVVNDVKQSYKCFGCGKGGDVYTFIQDIENLSFYESVLFLADKIGVEVPKSNDFDSNKYNLAKEIKELNLFVGRYYYKNLVKNDKALNYLKNRNINSEMIKSFGLGYADNTDNLLKELYSKFDKDIILNSGILSKSSNFLIFKDRIIFPIFNNRNEIIAFGGRQLSDYGPKYINSPETEVYSKKDNLYALNIARKNINDNAIFLVEGYMDVISMHQNGYKNTVASLGTSLTKEQATILSKICKNIFIIYDSDRAGIDATKRALDIIVETSLNPRVVNLEDVKDPDEFFKKYTKDDFQNKLNSSKDYLMFNLEYLKNNYDTNTSFGKDNFVKESTSFIKEYLEKPYASQTFVENAISYIAANSNYSIKSIGTDIFGKYFSTKQFATKDTSIIQNDNIIRNIDKEIFEKEQIILDALYKKNILFSDINISDFMYSENRKNYYLIKNNLDFSLKYTLDKTLKDDEYKIIIKSIKSRTLEMQIKNLENIQKYLIEKDNDFTFAIKIAEKIIELKNKNI